MITTRTKTLAAEPGEGWGQQFIDDDRPGAGGAVGAGAAVKAHPHDYTWLLAHFADKLDRAVNLGLTLADVRPRLDRVGRGVRWHAASIRGLRQGIEAGLLHTR